MITDFWLICTTLIRYRTSHSVAQFLLFGILKFLSGLSFKAELSAVLSVRSEKQPGGPPQNKKDAPQASRWSSNPFNSHPFTTGLLPERALRL
jgi:hypothetical protein